MRGKSAKSLPKPPQNGNLGQKSGFAQEGPMKPRFLCRLGAFCAALLLCGFSVGCGRVESRLETIFGGGPPVGVETAKPSHVGLLGEDIFVIYLSPADEMKHFVSHENALICGQGSSSIDCQKYPKRSVARNDNLPSQSLDGINAEVWLRGQFDNISHLFKPKGNRNDLSRSSTRILDADLALGHIGGRPKQLDAIRLVLRNPDYPSTLSIDNSLSIQEGSIGAFLGGLGRSLSSGSLLLQVAQSFQSNPSGDYAYQNQS